MVFVHEVDTAGTCKHVKSLKQVALITGRIHSDTVSDKSGSSSIKFFDFPKYSSSLASIYCFSSMSGVGSSLESGVGVKAGFISFTSCLISFATWLTVDIKTSTWVSAITFFAKIVNLSLRLFNGLSYISSEKVESKL